MQPLTARLAASAKAPNRTEPQKPEDRYSTTSSGEIGMLKERGVKLDRQFRGLSYIWCEHIHRETVTIDHQRTTEKNKQHGANHSVFVFLLLPCKHW